MIAIQISHATLGGYVYPVSYSKLGKLKKVSVGCGPFPKDFGTMTNAKKVIADMAAVGIKTTFKIVKL